MGNYEPYFKDEELIGLDKDLCSMLYTAHGLSDKLMNEATNGKIAHVPYRLTATTGGLHAPNSAHYKGLAVDIGLGNWEAGAERDGYRWAIMAGLFGAGFKRIEPCELHVHADRGHSPDYVSPWCSIGKDA